MNIIIAGPCQIESVDQGNIIATVCKAVCEKYGYDYYYVHCYYHYYYHHLWDYYRYCL